MVSHPWIDSYGSSMSTRTCEGERRVSYDEYGSRESIVQVRVVDSGQEGQDRVRVLVRLARRMCSYEYSYGYAAQLRLAPQLAQSLLVSVRV
eukprot:scaffold145908_cov21-Prasinocladus_malaysianus.AAC.1